MNKKFKLVVLGAVSLLHFISLNAYAMDNLDPNSVVEKKSTKCKEPDEENKKSKDLADHQSADSGFRGFFYRNSDLPRETRERMQNLAARHEENMKHEQNPEKRRKLQEDFHFQQYLIATGNDF